jgi:hypothetical protein
MTTIATGIATVDNIFHVFVVVPALFFAVAIVVHRLRTTPPQLRPKQRRVGGSGGSHISNLIIIMQ